MKIAITSEGNTLDSKVDLRFGRASSFCFFNQETGETSFIENENLNLNSGVGIKTAEKMIELGVKKVISGHFGPKAKDLLDKFEIQMEEFQKTDLTINEVLSKINS